MIETTLRMGALLLTGAACVGAVSLEIRHRLRTRELAAAAVALDEGLRRFQRAHGAFPPSVRSREDALDVSSLRPLVDAGFLSQASTVTAHLQDGALTAYHSPDPPRAPSEFWAVLVHGEDPTVQCLVADTADYPGAPGRTLRGAYVMRGAELERADL